MRNAWLASQNAARIPVLFWGSEMKQDCLFVDASLVLAPNSLRNRSVDLLELRKGFPKVAYNSLDQASWVLKRLCQNLAV